jgi:hypothetical protein
MQLIDHRLIFLSPYLILFLVLVLVSVQVHAQLPDSLRLSSIPVPDLKSVSVDSMAHRSDFSVLKIRPVPKPSPDSLSEALFKKYFPGKPALVFKGGYLNYNFFYRSNLDTPFIQNGVEQNLVNAAANLLLADKFPVRVSIAIRRTNSSYFRDYTYVKLELNTSEFRKLQSDKLRSYFSDLTGQLMDPHLKQQMELQENRLKNLSGFLNRPDIVKEFLQSKETVIHQEDLSGTAQQKDSTLKRANSIIDIYEQRQKDIKEVEKSSDSLKNTFSRVTKEIQQLKQVFNRNIYSPDGSEIIAGSLHKAGLNDPHFDKLSADLFSVRTFAIGQTMPDYTNLTVKNISVNGLNIEYNKNNLYAAVVAGFVNFEEMNFVLTGGSPARQYVAAARLGLGKKEGNHLIYTIYDGKKQIFLSQTNNNTTSVLGMSVEAQWMLSKNIRLTGEIAQSALQPSPFIVSDTSKKRFSLSDHTNQAWSVQLHAYFPASKTNLSGFYEYQGINFQCFNAYKVNASTSAWNLKADQILLSGMLHITAGIQKNDYVNPLVQQNYNSNTVFVTTTASFHKPLWPSLSIGYIPSSQYSIINNMAYESRYQAFNINMSHMYKIGSARSITTLMFNKFYNSLHDSGFVYYNASNIYLSQNFDFTAYTANLSISHTGNPAYTLDVMTGGISKTIKVVNSIGFGVKLNHLNTNENRLGYYINGRATIPELGTLSISGEKTFLPGMGNGLVSSDFFNVGFIRYFK